MIVFPSALGCPRDVLGGARRHIEDLDTTQIIKGFQIGSANWIYSVQPDAGQYDLDCRDQGEKGESLRINIERYIDTEQCQKNCGVDGGQQRGVRELRKEDENLHIQIGSPQATFEQVQERKGNQKCVLQTRLFPKFIVIGD
jgi:hypothetical protein